MWLVICAASCGDVNGFRWLMADLMVVLKAVGVFV